MKILYCYLVVLCLVLPSCLISTNIPTPEARIVHLNELVEKCLVYKEHSIDNNPAQQFSVRVSLHSIKNCPLSTVQYRYEFYDSDNFKVDESSWKTLDIDVANQDSYILESQSSYDEVIDFVLLLK